MDLEPDQPAPRRPAADPAEVSPDLPFDLQFRNYEQLTNIGIGGAGLTITLAGSVLSKVSLFVWIAAAEFGAAALIALMAQTTLIDHLFSRMPMGRRARVTGMVAIVLIGMGVGSLATSAFINAAH